VITLTREEAQQVLDALQAALSDDQPYIVRCKQTVETLRARLTQPELKWLGLTDDEIRNEAKNHVFDESFFSGAIWARGQIMGKTMDENKPELRSDIDQIYSAVMADTEALEDAKMTLEVIKKTDPGVYDEMINDTLSLIRRALSNSILGAIDRLVDPEEPVAWVVYDSENNDIVWTEAGKKLKQNTRLYTYPPKREWTDDEFIAEAVKRGHYTAEEKKEWKGLEADGESQEIWLKVMEETKDKRHLPVLEFAVAIEAKLKEKNT